MKYQICLNFVWIGSLDMQLRECINNVPRIKGKGKIVPVIFNWAQRHEGILGA
jgi:hypothetical protein